jgi:hypothetical protein
MCLPLPLDQSKVSNTSTYIETSQTRIVSHPTNFQLSRNSLPLHKRPPPPSSSALFKPISPSTHSKDQRPKKHFLPPLKDQQQFGEIKILHALLSHSKAANTTPIPTSPGRADPIIAAQSKKKGGVVLLTYVVHTYIHTLIRRTNQSPAAIYLCIIKKNAAQQQLTSA